MWYLLKVGADAADAPMQYSNPNRSQRPIRVVGTFYTAVAEKIGMNNGGWALGVHNQPKKLLKYFSVYPPLGTPMRSWLSAAKLTGVMDAGVSSKAICRPAQLMELRGDRRAVGRDGSPVGHRLNQNSGHCGRGGPNLISEAGQTKRIRYVNRAIVKNV